MFFKGYVETKDKKCIEKFKNRTDFKNYKQVQSLPEFAGILAEKQSWWMLMTLTSLKSCSELCRTDS